ncbi:MAG: hypothetical protein EOO81_12560, partial [Oxalobacteraceae bacterium]
MKMKRLALACGVAIAAVSALPAAAEIFRITLPASAPNAQYDGRILLILTPKGETEPRFQVAADYDAAQVLGINVEGLQRGKSVVIDNKVLGYPSESLSAVPAGEYFVQAVMHKYDTFKLGNGKVVKLPAARGAG